MITKRPHVVIPAGYGQVVKNPTNQSTVVYVSAKLGPRHGMFMRDMRQALGQHDIELRALKGARDIWLRDFCPIQRHDGVFVSFTYNPDYLRIGYKHLITDWIKVKPLPEQMKLVDCGLVLDGGNVVLQGRSAIVTKKVFDENPTLSHAEVEKRLRDSLELDQLILIPNEDGDIFGHADGMVAWAGSDHVLMNDYRRLDLMLHRELKKTLMKAGLDVDEIPYVPCFRNGRFPSAEGTYSNLLILPGVVLFPVYGIKADERAMIRIEAVFGNRQVVPIRASSVAREGGCVHCVTWEIRHRESNRAEYRSICVNHKAGYTRSSASRRRRCNASDSGDMDWSC